MAQLEEIIVKPLITEKSSLATEKHNRYSFRVKLHANKNQIKSAIEKLYEVKVTKVRTRILPGKLKQAGKKVKKTSKMKKAYIQLGIGQKIEFFKGI
jgi:large subunit ribosomal protein L23